MHRFSVIPTKSDINAQVFNIYATEQSAAYLSTFKQSSNTMSTNQEKILYCNIEHSLWLPALPQVDVWQKVTTPRPDYEAFTFSHHLDVSNYLFLKPDVAPDALTLYFRCLDDYYTIYIFTPGEYYYRTISREEKRFLERLCNRRWRPDHVQLAQCQGQYHHAGSDRNGYAHRQNPDPKRRAVVRRAKSQQSMTPESARSYAPTRTAAPVFSTSSSIS